MTDFFREVNEDVRRDRAVEIVSKYQYLFLALAVLIVAATIFWRVWEGHRTGLAEAASIRYEQALQLAHDGKTEEAEKAFEALAKDASAGYSALARLRFADTLASQDKEAALKIYEDLGKAADFDTSLRDVARFHAVLLEIDKATPKEIEDRIAPLADAKFAYHNSVRELLGLAALKREDYSAAGRWFDELAVDPAAPASLRRRAEAFLGLVAAGKPASK
jgi:hypothetical protein